MYATGFCEAWPDRPGEVSSWADQYRQHWESKLDNLENYVIQLKNERNGKHNKQHCQPRITANRKAICKIFPVSSSGIGGAPILNAL